MARLNTATLPPQRLSYSKKTKEWRKDNIDYADKQSFYHNESVRKSLRNKVINLNLYNGVVDIRDLTNIVNPYAMDASFIPDNIPHHPIVVPKIDLLVGEEIKRRFDWRVVVTNSDAISAKEEAKKKILFEKTLEYLQANYSEEELEVKLQEFEKFMKYDWQDLREKMANQILRHYWEEQNFGNLFNLGFKDALIVAEEIYQIDIVHDEPVLTKLNPLKVHAVRSGNSDRIEDSSIIIIEDHWSPGKIVDYFHDELKPEDIDYIMDYSTVKSGGSYSDDYNNHVLLRDGLDGMTNNDTLNTIFNIAEINGHYFSSDFTDENGNIRVLRVYWRSLKKIKKVKYYDSFGEEQYKIMSEEYIVDKDMGEEATTLWVNEWWEGTKIGKDIYLAMKPKNVQYNRLNNPSYSHPGIIGQIYNTNQGKAVSLLDRCKNYQYMYDVIWDRLNKAIATNYGKIFELDLAKVPENWEIDKWLHFAIVNKIAVIDSFKEGNQGAATGKLAGGFNTSGGRSIDMETGTYIQFGFGSETDSETTGLVDPSRVALKMHGRRNITTTTFDPNEMISTNKLGISPSGKVLRILYRTNDAVSAITPANTVRSIVTRSFDFENETSLNFDIMNSVMDSLEVNNDLTFTGDAIDLTREELKIRAKSYFSTQGRAVTAQDYESLIYSMPAKFGGIARVGLVNDPSSTNRRISMYVVSQDENGSLMMTNSVTKNNIKNWISRYKSLNDVIDIIDAKIVNFGIEFSIVSSPNFNSNSVINNAVSKLQEYFEDHLYIGEPVYITEIYNTLNKTEGVVDVKKVNIFSKSSAGYSPMTLDFDELISKDGSYLKIPRNVIMELKYPNLDIRGIIR